VDFNLLKGDSKRASFLTCDELLDLYLSEENPPPMIDLTGGQPDLIPEWIPWMMQSIIDNGLEDKIYLWSDDNLSNDFFWKYLSDKQIDLISSYKMYSRVCCFKGIDSDSFSLNTKADKQLFFNQFDLCKRLLKLNLDLYFYITLTATTNTRFEIVVPQFFDYVQAIDELLPLRIIPLRVIEFTPVILRMNKGFNDMLMGQYQCLEVWQNEMTKRFSSKQLKQPITEVQLGKY